MFVHAVLGYGTAGMARRCPIATVQDGATKAEVEITFEQKEMTQFQRLYPHDFDYAYLVYDTADIVER